MEWRTDILGDVCDIAIGGTPSRSVPEYWASKGNDGLPWVSIADMHSPFITKTRESITNLGAKRSNGSLLEAGTLLMSFKLTIGRLSFAGIPLRTNEAIAALRCPRIDQRFLYHGLHYWDLLGDVDQAIKGATLNKQKLKKIPVCYPEDPDIQRAIADALDAVDRACEMLAKEIVKQERVRAGLLQALLTRGIDENGEIRPRVLRSRGQNNAIPNGWTKTTIGGLGKWRGGLTPSKQVSRYWAGDHLWVSPKDVKAAVLHDTEDHLSQDAIDSCALRIFPAGSIFTVFRSGILKHSLPIATCAAPFTVNQDIKVLEPNDGVSNAYAFYLMRFHSSSLLRKAVKAGTTVESIDTIVFLEYPVALPRPEEQALIVRALEQQNNELETDRKVHAKLQRLKTGLMRDLLSGRVSVEPLLDLPPASPAKMEKP